MHMTESRGETEMNTKAALLETEKNMKATLLFAPRLPIGDGAIAAVAVICAPHQAQASVKFAAHLWGFPYGWWRVGGLKV